jgi:hypothetical protein
VWGGNRIHTCLINLDGTKQLEKGCEILHIKSFQRQKRQDNYYETVMN